MRVILKTILSNETPLPVFDGGGRACALRLVRSSRARSLRLVIDPRRGDVRLTMPGRYGLNEALRWVETKRNWIEGELARLPAASPMAPGMILPFRGVDRLLDWSPDHIRHPVVRDGTIHVGGQRESLERRLLRWLREEARRLLDAETRALAARLGLRPGKISVGDPVSRWGSCSASGDIRFSWRLILAPDFVRQATVAHEVAHLVHMHHGPSFHALVAELYGSDPAPSRLWLRRNGSALHAIGRR